MNLQELKKIGPEKLSPLRVEQLISNYEKAVEVLKFYGDKENWFSELPDYLSNHNCINEDDLEREKPFFYKIGGKLARQTLREIGEEND